MEVVALNRSGRIEVRRTDTDDALLPEAKVNSEADVIVVSPVSAIGGWPSGAREAL